MDNKMNNTLSQSATLVRFTAKHPSGVKVDRYLRDRLAVDVKTGDARLLNVSKNIFGVNANKYFRRIQNNFRNNYYYPLTVAWDDNTTDYDGKVVTGYRLCPNTNLERLQDAMDKAKTDYFKEVKNFVKQYPKIVEQSKRELGQAFEENDFPDVDDLEAKFKFDFELSLVPSFGGSDIRINVSEKMQQRIERDAVKRANKNVKNIFKLTVGALVEQVDHIVDKLESYDPNNKQKGGFFKDSSFDKLRQAVDVLPAINSDILGNDKDVTDAHQKLCGVLAQINSVDSLRDETELGQGKCKQVADELADSIGSLKGSFFDKAFGGDK